MKGLWHQGLGGMIDLINGPAPATADGIEALLDPEYEAWDLESPSMAGSTPNGGRLLPRSVILPISPRANKGEEYTLLARAVARSFSFTEDSRLICLSDLGELRTLTWRVRKKPLQMETAHSVLGFAALVYAGIAHDPLWRGERVSIPFPGAVARERVSYYGGGPVGSGSRGPAFHRYADTNAGRALVENPGDEPVAPLWRLPGPMSSFVIDVAGSRLAGAFPVAAGEELQIDADPRALSFTLVRGGQRTSLPWRQFTEQEFALIQPGTVPVTITAVGGGVPSVEFEPGYHRGE